MSIAEPGESPPMRADGGPLAWAGVPKEKLPRGSPGVPNVTGSLAFEAPKPVSASDGALAGPPNMKGLAPLSNGLVALGSETGSEAAVIGALAGAPNMKGLASLSNGLVALGSATGREAAVIGALACAPNKALTPTELLT